MLFVKVLATTLTFTVAAQSAKHDDSTTCPAEAAFFHAIQEDRDLVRFDKKAQENANAYVGALKNSLDPRSGAAKMSTDTSDHQQMTGYDFKESMEMGKEYCKNQWRVLWETRYVEEMFKLVYQNTENEIIRTKLKTYEEAYYDGAIGKFWASTKETAKHHLKVAKHKLNKAIYGTPIKVEDSIQDSSIFDESSLNRTYLKCYYDNHGKELSTWGLENLHKRPRPNNVDIFEYARSNPHHWHTNRRAMPSFDLKGRWAIDAQENYSFAVNYDFLDLFAICVESLAAEYQKGDNSKAWKIKEDIKFSKIKLSVSNRYGGSTYPLTLYVKTKRGYESFDGILNVLLGR